MGRILIAEPHHDVSSLFEFVVDRLGHEAVVIPVDAADLPDVDAVILEPADAETLALGRRLHDAFPALPIVCASIFPASAEALALEPVTYLEKPFGLGALERALTLALAVRAAA
jgi:hypothetical protein